MKHSGKLGDPVLLRLPTGTQQDEELVKGSVRRELLGTPFGDGAVAEATWLPKSAVSGALRKVFFLQDMACPATWRQICTVVQSDTPFPQRKTFLECVCGV